MPIFFCKNVFMLLLVEVVALVALCLACFRESTTLGYFIPSLGLGWGDVWHHWQNIIIKNRPGTKAPNTPWEGSYALNTSGL